MGNGMSDEARNARLRWHGNLNHIPVEIAYNFELQYIIDNRREDGFRGSKARIASARRELVARG